jgi:Ca2+-binding RTX toxin-like protein
VRGGAVVRYSIVTSCISLLAISIPYLTQKAVAMFDIFESENIKRLLLDDNVITCQIEICIGSNKDNTIIGSQIAETIYGLKGSDLIQGNAGDDIVDGGIGSDTIQGGSGSDKLFGKEGNDFLYADSSSNAAAVLRESKPIVGITKSNTFLFFDNSSSSLNEGNSSNTNLTFDVFEAVSIDILSFRTSILDGGNGDDHINGGSGNDVLIGGPGHDMFDCGEGEDQILDFNGKEDTLNTNCEIIFTPK